MAANIEYGEQNIPHHKENPSFSNNGADYAKYNAKIDGTLQFIEKDGTLSRNHNRRLYRNRKNKLINKKS
jgi:hypothetical protein